MSDASDVSDVAATATNKGDVSVLITGADGKRVQAEISIQLAEKLKGQIEAALVTARIRANRAIAPASYPISSAVIANLRSGTGAAAEVSCSR